MKNNNDNFLTASERNDMSAPKSAKDTSQWEVCETPQDCGLIPSLGVLLWLGWPGILPWCFIYLILFGSITKWTIFISSCTISMLLPREFPLEMGLRVGEFMARSGAKYFGLKTTLEDSENLKKASEKRKGIFFCLEPHDILPFPAVAFHPCLKRVPSQINCCVLTSSAILQTPFMRQIFSWILSHPADKRTIRSLLSRNLSPVLVPGGVQEVTLLDPSQPHQLTLFLKSRKGFVKIALENGTPIVPAFAFNLDGCCKFWLPRGKLFKNLARSLGFMPVFVWGRFNIPLAIPKPKKIHVVIGSPIDIPFEGTNVTQDNIDKWHDIFLKELEALFERHKYAEGYGDRKLNIV